MPEELSIMPEPRGNEPPAVQAQMLQIREEQMMLGERAKTSMLKTLNKVVDFVSEVAEGKRRVTQYTSKGEEYYVDGPQYLFEHGVQLNTITKTAIAAMGEQEAPKNSLTVAILGRTGEKPRKVSVSDGSRTEIIDIETDD